MIGATSYWKLRCQVSGTHSIGEYHHIDMVFPIRAAYQEYWRFDDITIYRR